MAAPRVGGCAVAFAFGFGFIAHLVAFLIAWATLFPDAVFLWMTRRSSHSYSIAGGGSLQLQPGETMELVPMARGEFDWPGTKVISACNRWSVTPDDGGVSVNSWTGRLRVLPHAKHGSRYRIRGKLGLRGIPVEGLLVVYRLDANPLIGQWGSERLRDGYVWFGADGNFVVAMRPQIEDMVDYSGTYRFDQRTGALEMTTADAPPDADLSGRFRIENERRLVLEDIYLGTFGSEPRGTEETFRK